MSKLLIVESPAKAKTIGKYLGSDFVVKSSVGHIRDLPKKGLSIKIEPDGKSEDKWSFIPSYEISDDKKNVVTDLRKAAKEADEIFLAPDPDREGEAIAWHLSEVLKTVAKDKPVHRVTYNEITKNAVLTAIESPGDINLSRVDAQQSRRIIDRLVGFKVSPLLWKSLNYGYTLSAGRVQSVALRLLVEREREISSFIPEPYWIMGVEASKGSKATSFVAKLSRIDGEKPSVKTQEHASMIIDDLDGSSIFVSSIKETPKTRHPSPPFTTSTMQQTASSMLGLSPQRTMSIAQKLYESGLITYMRTDSVNIAQVARDAARKFIGETYGSDFVPEKPNIYKSRSGAQEAHEAIRPTDVENRPGNLKLDAQSAKLYDLIWRRFVASQMSDAKLSLKTVYIEAEKDDLIHSYTFTASTTSIVFEGFLSVIGSSLIKKGKATEEEGDEDNDEVKSLPPLKEGDKLVAERWLSDRKETKPPSRYSEASLVKALEENGVGRPSTYAQTIEVLVGRQYATRESRQLVPTKRGEDVSDWLVKKLESLFDVGYTAEMEAELDKIEDGTESGNVMLSRFYKKFTEWVDGAKEPPPPDEKFLELFSFLDEVSKWNDPVKRGKYVYDDKGFYDSVKTQFADKSKAMTVRQLQALVKLSVSYVDQVSEGERRLIDMGYGPELQRVKNAPPTEFVKWCFLTIDRIGGLQKNPFLQSLREQVDRGRILSEKQFVILARSIGKNAGVLPDADQVRARLEPFVPGGFDVAPVDPTIPAMFELLENVKDWKEPIQRGRRTYDDHEFVDSLRSQYLRSNSLSSRQLIALKRVCVLYKSQIPNFDEVAEKLGLTDLPVLEKANTAEKDARSAARAAARAEKSAIKAMEKKSKPVAKRSRTSTKKK